MNWDQYFMNLVYLIAMRSKDQNTHVGAVIVRPDNSIVSTGYNSFPKGIDDNVTARQQRPYKYFFMSHAEHNAIVLSKQSVEGYKLYTNGIPCSNCTKTIIQAGIKEVIYDEDWSLYCNTKWNEESEASKQMLEEAGIILTPMSVELVQIYKHINGKDIYGNLL